MAKGVKGSGPIEDVATRTSFLLKPSKTQKLKHIAFIDGTTQTAILDQLLGDYITKWEKKNGTIPVK